MSTVNPMEALQAARRLVRGFPGAPDPRRQAQDIFRTLARAPGWSPRAQDEILALGAWLQTHPPVDALKRHCAAVLAKLG